MKIAFTSKGQDWDAQIDPRFGRTEFLGIYDEESEKLQFVDNSEIENQAHGAGPLTAKKIFELDPDVLITGNGPGGNAEGLLRKRNMKIYVGAGIMTLKQAYEAWQNDKLEEF